MDAINNFYYNIIMQNTKICNNRVLCHSFFECDICKERCLLHIETDLNICFDHKLILCDPCFDVHESRIKQIKRQRDKTKNIFDHVKSF